MNEHIILDSDPSVQTTLVPREPDIPYWSAPAIQFVYTSNAALNAGFYTWADAPSAFTPNRPVKRHALYYFRRLTFTADVAELDYTANLSTTPQFFTFRRSDADAVLFREPILMTSFLQNFEYRLFWETKQDPAQQPITGTAVPGMDSGNVRLELLGAFRGSLVQGPGLVGKNSITLTAVISATEITDMNYINRFKDPYPFSLPGEGRIQR